MFSNDAKSHTRLHGCLPMWRRGHFGTLFWLPVINRWTGLWTYFLPLFDCNCKPHGSGAEVTTSWAGVEELALLLECVRLCFDGFDNVIDTVRTSSYFLWHQRLKYLRTAVLSQRKMLISYSVSIYERKGGKTKQHVRAWVTRNGLISFTLLL